MSNRPLVSVIIIFWNAERFFQEAIESVFEQTYDNWQLLLVNGRPTNPISNPATRHGQLKGPEMLQFKKVVARDLAEREREAKSM